jgi:sec-independent protein translocase protein TatB
MFDIGWSELLIVGIVALVVVGPKDLPVLLRTIGKYVGMMRRQATEFRAQFDDAMRETELEQLKQDVTKLKTETESVLRDTERSVSSDFTSMQSELNGTLPPSSTGAISEPVVPPPALPPVSGAGAAAAAAAAAAGVAQPTADPAAKTGA